MSQHRDLLEQAVTLAKIDAKKPGRSGNIASDSGGWILPTRSVSSSPVYGLGRNWRTVKAHGLGRPRHPGRQLRLRQCTSVLPSEEYTSDKPWPPSATTICSWIGFAARGGRARLRHDLRAGRNRDFQRVMINQHDIGIAAEVLNLNVPKEDAHDLRDRIKTKDRTLRLNDHVSSFEFLLGPVLEGRVDQSPLVNITDRDHKGPTRIIEPVIPFERLVQNV